MYRYDVPVNSNPLTLFEFSVRKVIALGMMNVSNTHQTWANLIFNYEKKAFIRSELMSIIKREYSRYFDEELQYMFLEEKIRTNFPHFFGLEEDLDIFDRMLQALDAECIEQKDPRNRKMYRVSSLDIISSQDGQYVYKAHLVIEEGDDPHFSEGILFEFRTDDMIYFCEVVEFDYVNALIANSGYSYKADGQRNVAVIFLTDGIPGQDGGSSTTAAANAVIGKALTAKNNGAITSAMDMEYSEKIRKYRFRRWY